MTFEEILDQAIAMLQRRGRLTYGTLKRQFQLDDAALEDLKNELIEGQRLAVDERGNVLVWTGHTAAAAAPAPVQAQAPLTYPPPHLAEKILAARPTLEGERKQVTVFFTDIKDSTRLIEGLDPEAAQQLLDPAIHLMMAAVHRFEGTVNQVLGDGIMALFAAPIAHDDHALRACYAALAVQHAIRSYANAAHARGGLLQLRVGLNAGEVVVRAIGNDLHTDYSAVGQHTHLAARMEQLAAPGSILLTAATLRLVEGLVLLQQGMAVALATGQELSRPLCLVLLAEAAGHGGQVVEGLRWLAETLTAIEESGRAELQAEAYRLQGKLLLRQVGPDAAQAETCFQQALSIARRQQAMSLELRAAMSLSWVWDARASGMKHGSCSRRS